MLTSGYIFAYKAFILYGSFFSCAKHLVDQTVVNEKPESRLDRYRQSFEAANLAHFCNQPEKNRELLVGASRTALAEGHLSYHEFFQGELSFADNNLPDALKHYDLALKEEPHNSLFLSNHATALLVTGEAKLAIKEFRKALTQNPNERHALVGLIAALTEAGGTQHAKKLANGLIRDLAFEDSYKFLLVESLVDLDEDKEALRIVNHLSRKFPGNVYCKVSRLRIESKLAARNMAGFKRRPYLRAVLQCDSLQILNGKPHCEGVFDFVNTFAFPAVTPPFVVFACVAGGNLFAIRYLCYSRRTFFS